MSEIGSPGGCPGALCVALSRAGDCVPLRTQALAARLEAMGVRGQAERIAEMAARGKRGEHEAPALRRRAEELSAAADTLDALVRVLGGAAR